MLQESQSSWERQLATEAQTEQAIKTLKAKRALKIHAGVYVITNTMLIAVWALDGGGYFWPIWVLLSWGLGLVYNAWSTYGMKPITQADIDAEIRRQQP